MSEFTTILDRINIHRIATCLLYGSEPVSEITDSFEDRIKSSYTLIFENLKTLYPNADKNNEPLSQIISDFAFIHSDVFLQTGLLIGFQLYKVLEQKYHDPKLAKLEQVLQTYTGSMTTSPANTSASCNGESAPCGSRQMCCPPVLPAKIKNPEKESENILEPFFEERMYNALIAALSSDDAYQNAVKAYDKELSELEKLHLTARQTHTIDTLLSESNAIGAAYGAAAYRLGFHDARKLISELLEP